MVKFKRIFQPTDALVKELIADIRRPDLKELYLINDNGYEAVWNSIENSQYCYAVRDVKRNLLAIFGIAAGQININKTQATPIWFLGTNKAYRHNRALVHFGREFCERFINEVGPLCNFIWAGNEPSIRYIRHMGARFLDVMPMGKSGEMFVPFILDEVVR